MLDIGHCDIYGIHPLEHLQVVGGMAGYAVLGTQALPCRLAAGGGAEGVQRKGRGLGQPGQKLPDDPSRAQDAELVHSVFLLLPLLPRRGRWDGWFIW